VKDDHKWTIIDVEQNFVASVHCSFPRNSQEISRKISKKSGDCSPSEMMYKTNDKQV